MSIRARFFFRLFLVVVAASFAVPSLAAEAQKNADPQKTSTVQKKAADPKKSEAQKKPAATPKQSVAMKKPLPAKAVPAKSSVAQSSDNPERLKQDLDIFAKKCIISMNSQLKPGLNSKEVTPHPSGGYVARYTLVDADSLETSYNPAENKYVQYVGKMIYHEVEYTCMGKTKEQALAGPFSEVNRVPVTELIKYMKGKWTY